MNLRSIIALAALTLFAMTAQAQGTDDGEVAQADTSVMFSTDGVSIQQIADILQEEGYKAQLDKDSQGDPLIRTKMGGLNVKVFFYLCSEEALCEDIQFSVGFDLEDGLSTAKVQKWNKEYRFAKTYLDDEDDPYLEIDLQLVPGGTPDLVKGYIATADSLISQFADYIDF